MRPSYHKYLFLTLATWGPGAVACLLAYVLLLQPQADQLSDLNRRIAQKTETHRAALQTLAPARQTELRTRAQELTRQVGDFLTEFDDAPALTFAIGQVANQTKVNALASKDRAAPSTSFTETRQISENYMDVTFAGAFPQFAAFLNALERNRPVVFIDEFTLARPESAESLPEVRLVVATLVKKASEGGGKANVTGIGLPLSWLEPGR
jgi:hypothetical protein